MPENNHNAKQDREIAEVKTDVKWLIREVGDIKNNHLVSIYQSINDIKDNLSQRPTWLITGMVSLLVGLIVFLLTQ